MQSSSNPNIGGHIATPLQTMVCSISACPFKIKEKITTKTTDGLFNNISIFHQLVDNQNFPTQVFRCGSVMNLIHTPVVRPCLLLHLPSGSAMSTSTPKKNCDPI